MCKRMMRLCSFALCLLLCGCAKNDSPQGLKYDVANFPAWEDFSDTRYESYADEFAEIETVIYKYNGTAKSIEANDPRVIRLLNFLAYSNKNMLSTWEQGYVSQERVEAYMGADSPMLEITFEKDETFDPDVYADLQKIVICGDSYLRFSKIRADTESANDDMRVERYFPYGELIMSYSTEEHEYKNLLSYDGWGSGDWIDLPEYAGFSPK